LGVKRKPDPPKTVRRGQQWVVCDISVIVPDESAAQGRPVRDENRQNDKNRAPKLRLGYFFHGIKPITRFRDMAAMALKYFMLEFRL